RYLPGIKIVCLEEDPMQAAQLAEVVRITRCQCQRPDQAAVEGLPFVLGQYLARVALRLQIGLGRLGVNVGQPRTGGDAEGVAERKQECSDRGPNERRGGYIRQRRPPPPEGSSAGSG